MVCAFAAECPMSFEDCSPDGPPVVRHCDVCGQDVSLTFSYALQSELNGASPYTMAPIVQPAWMANPSAGGGAPADAPRRPAPAPSGAASAAPQRARPTPTPPAPAPAPPPEPEPIRARRLFISRPSGERAEIQNPPFVIGRSKKCEMVIVSSQVSRRHCQIIKNGDEYVLEDLGSANGVFKDGERIQRAPIENGDEFFVGNEQITFELRG